MPSGQNLQSLALQRLLSGYASLRYDVLLPGWHTLELQVMNQGGVRTEKLWFNFVVDRVHWANFAGKNFTDRQRIKRKAQRWGKNYALCGNTRTLETTCIAKANACGICAEDLSATPCQGHAGRTRIDLVFEKVVTHVDAELTLANGVAGYGLMARL